MAGHHARLLRTLFPKIELWFASRDREKARLVASQHRGAGFFGSYTRAAESEEFDISFLTTPHAFHADLAVLSAKHGKDLIIEKPVTRTLEELATVEAAVDESGVRCTVAENYYFKPAIGVMSAFMREGLIGEVLFIDLTKTNRQKESGWRTDRALMGGGALLEGGVHWLNALISLSGGIPVGVIAIKPEVKEPTLIPLEDSLLLVARFSNGVVGRLLHSWRVPNRFFGMGLSKIYGTEGVITFESNGLFCSVYGRKRKKRLMHPRDFLGFRPMHRSFIQDWVSGKPWRPSLGRIRQDLALVHAAYRSLETRRFEKV
jgi:predicted dehydrogenase